MSKVLPRTGLRTFRSFSVLVFSKSVQFRYLSQKNWKTLLICMPFAAKSVGGSFTGFPIIFSTTISKAFSVLMEYTFLFCKNLFSLPNYLTISSEYCLDVTEIFVIISCSDNFFFKFFFDAFWIQSWVSFIRFSCELHGCNTTYHPLMRKTFFFIFILSICRERLVITSTHPRKNKNFSWEL